MFGRSCGDGAAICGASVFQAKGVDRPSVRGILGGTERMFNPVQRVTGDRDDHVVEPAVALRTAGATDGMGHRSGEQMRIAEVVEPDVVEPGEAARAAPLQRNAR